MKPVSLTAIAALLAFGATGTTAQAVPSDLRYHQPINNGLTIVAIADILRKECDTIEPRMIRAYTFIKTLENKAKADGFSDEEIDAFVKNKDEKARVNGAARTYLETKGVSLADKQTYCTVGQAEIDRNSQIGALLRSK